MERWRQIESLFQEALQRDPAERDNWLREACHGDGGLQREVASLLANHYEATDFEPWAAVAAARLIDGSASLKAGQRLGPYEIIAPIGAGGMGEVYKARDTRLKRDVAIKVCAAQFSERFEREARAIASLNHPNICQLYDVGPNFLVMELVEGENLSGPLPLETALNHARQIAEALEAAHEKGIVHRDLKPANVKITPEGVVKVLDFGLAKLADPVAIEQGEPTLTVQQATRAGVILGTAAYMSPEQARGMTVDKRVDIWSIGVVLYEMLTGWRLFDGESLTDTLAAVLTREPEWNRVPVKARQLLRSCLEKDPKRRLRDVGDAWRLLECWCAASGCSKPVPFFDRLPFHFDKQSCLPQHPSDAGRTRRHNVRVEHHKRQPPVAFQRVLQMEADNGLLLPILQPEIAGNPAVVLVHLAVAFPPIVELSGGHIEPSDEPPGGDLGLRRPAPDEIHDLVPRIVRNPDPGQSSPSVFFSATCSAIRRARARRSQPGQRPDQPGLRVRQLHRIQGLTAQAPPGLGVYYPRSNSTEW